MEPLPPALAALFARVLRRPGVTAADLARLATHYTQRDAPERQLVLAEQQRRLTETTTSR